MIYIAVVALACLAVIRAETLHTENITQCSWLALSPRLVLQMLMFHQSGHDGGVCVVVAHWILGVCEFTVKPTLLYCWMLYLLLSSTFVLNTVSLAVPKGLDWSFLAKGKTQLHWCSNFSATNMEDDLFIVECVREAMKLFHKQWQDYTKDTSQGQGSNELRRSAQTPVSLRTHSKDSSRTISRCSRANCEIWTPRVFIQGYVPVTCTSSGRWAGGLLVWCLHHLKSLISRKNMQFEVKGHLRVFFFFKLPYRFYLEPYLGETHLL